MRRPPPPPTDRSVLAHARAYVDRFGPTEHALRSFLARRTRPAAEAHEVDPREVRGWIDAAVEHLAALGFVDDRRWSESRVRALRRQGKSARAIRAALGAKGVATAIVDEVLDAEDADPDLEAALTWARKHRIGPWRTGPADADGRRRELLRLARKGFSYDVARRVVHAAPPDEQA